MKTERLAGFLIYFFCAVCLFVAFVAGRYDATMVVR